MATFTNPSKLALLERRIGLEGSFHSFAKRAFPHVETGVEFVDNWHVHEICAHLEACFRGECPQLAIAVPPGCMKSLLTSVLFPAWAWVRNPGLRFAAISYDAELTGTRDGGKVVQLVQSDWFRERWGDRVRIPTDAAKGNIQTSAGGFRFATSIAGKYTGRHVHFEIVDDPLKPQDLSKATLEELRTWRTAVAPSRRLPTKYGEPGARIYIMQRLHEDDAIGQAEAEEKLDPGSWTFLRLPMRYEPGAACVTPFGGDRREEEGALLWPERFFAEEVDKRERIMGPRQTATQHQQRPSPDGGLIFKADDLRYYAVVPSRFDQVVLSVDAAFKGLDTSDFVVIQVWGRVGGDFYLLDQIRRRMSFTATVAEIRRMARKWPRASAKLIEDKANGAAIVDTLCKEIPGMIARNPEGGKEVRAQAAEPYFAAHNVYLPGPVDVTGKPDPRLPVVNRPGAEPETVPDVDLFVGELLGFPTAANDDTVDACSQALIYFREKTSTYADALKKYAASA